MAKFKWYKNGNLTAKAKAYLSLTYKNQYSQGSLYNQKDKAKKLIAKSRKRKKETITKEILKKTEQKVYKLKKKRPKTKTRKQAVINYRSNKDPYYLSIRVLTINPNYQFKALKIALNKLKNRINERSVYLTKKGYSVTVDLDNFKPDSPNTNNTINRYIGIEKTKIPYSEDKILNDNNIHYEILVGRNKPLSGTI